MNSTEELNNRLHEVCKTLPKKKSHIKLLSALQENQPAYTSELCEITALSRSTLLQIKGTLLRPGLIAEIPLEMRDSLNEEEKKKINSKLSHVMQFLSNKGIIENTGARILVTSCPICFKD